MNRYILKSILLLIISNCFINNLANACEACALYNASRLQGYQENSLMLSISEQFTDFKNETPENSLSDGEVVNSYSISQLSASYDLSEYAGIQATLPLINRSYDSFSSYRVEEENEFGIGDASIVANYVPYQNSDLNHSIMFITFAGVKLPTGKTNDLETHSSADHHMEKHGTTLGSGGHGGHDALTLGTGSLDYILGTSFISRYKRALLMANIQYNLRTEGDYDYQFADEYIWDFGPGYYFYLEEDNMSLAFRVSLTGEHKSNDSQAGVLIENSNVENIYLGPQLLATFGNGYAAELAVDFPISSEADGTTEVPQLRVRSALSVRF